MTRRLFIGITFPDEAADALVADQAALSPHLKTGRASSRENLHLTLIFLGEVDEDVERRVRDAVQATAAASSPLTLSLGDLGSFDHHNRLVLWRGIQSGAGLDELRSLQARLVEELLDRGVGFEDRAYRPHATLVRNARLEGKEPHVVRPVSFDVKAIRLMWSHHPEGGRLTYTPVFSAELGTGAPDADDGLAR